jgi:hypothetical protein
MRGSKVKRLRRFFPHSDEKPVWRKYKRLMNREGKSQSSTYKGPGVPVAKGTWGRSDELAYGSMIQRHHWVGEPGHAVQVRTALIVRHPLHEVGAVFGSLNKKGKVQALWIGMLAERVSKPALMFMINHLKTNKEYFEPDERASGRHDEAQQPEGHGGVRQDPDAPVA